MTPPRIVIGNWKMNPPTIAEALDLARSVARIDPGRVDVGVAPPDIALASVASVLGDSTVRTYAQDVHWEEKGGYTGGTAASMLRGTAFGTLVGHSEVRRDQGDDDDRVARKMVAALRGGLRVLACLGESEEAFAEGNTLPVIERQTRVLFKALYAASTGETLSERLIGIAYEPIWAIGTGRPATGAHAEIAARRIREVMTDEGFDGDTFAILYGGSVTAASVAEFAGLEELDGALVGGASLKAEEFAAIVRAFR